ncbi:MAG: proline dehydrogenase family protein [archaeon]
MCWYRPLLFPVAALFIAGETTQTAIQYGRKLQNKGITPIFDILGEGARSREDTVRVGNEYIELIDQMKHAHIHGAISLKLTAFALDLDEETCVRSVARVVRHAHEKKVIVWIDMEGSGYTNETLKIYRALVEKFDNVGICIQSYLKRSKKDVLSLIADNAKIRIVKGIYPQKSSGVFDSHRKINQNFKELLTLMSEKDAWTAVGSHDMDIISHALTLPFPNHMEFQLLKGIRDDEKRLLVEHGYNVCEYVPYGKDWDQYVVRRLGERLRNVKWIIQSWIGMD